ncbi:MAG: DNA polymerase sliding clamp [Thermocladium sp.]|jgi:proliferating cell nuclear antigen
MSSDFDEEEKNEELEEAEEQPEEEMEAEVGGKGSLSGEGGVYSLLFPKGKDVRYVFSAMATMLKDAAFSLGPDGVKLRAMDSSKVSIIMLDIPSSSLDEVNIGEEIKVGISFDVLRKIMRRISSRDKVEFIVDKPQGKLHVVIYTKKGKEGGMYRKFSLSLIDVSMEDVPEPNLEYPIRITADLDSMLDIIAAANDISDIVSFTAAANQFIIRAEGEGGKAIESIYQSTDELFHEYVVNTEGSASYSAKQILGFMSQMRQICDAVTMEFATDKPLKLTFNFSTGSLLLYLLQRT